MRCCSSRLCVASFWQWLVKEGKLVCGTGIGKGKEIKRFNSLEFLQTLTDRLQMFVEAVVSSTLGTVDIKRLYREHQMQ